MTMDNHSKNVCLVSALHILGYLLETIQYQFHCFNDCFSHMLPLLGFDLPLAATFGLTILGVVKKRRLFFIPCFVVIGLELIYPIKFYHHPDGFYMIALEILSVYAILTLFLDLRPQSQQNPREVTADIQEEQSVDVLKYNLITSADKATKAVQQN